MELCDLGSLWEAVLGGVFRSEPLRMPVRRGVCYCLLLPDNYCLISTACYCLLSTACYCMISTACYCMLSTACYCLVDLRAALPAGSSFRIGRKHLLSNAVDYSGLSTF